MPLNKSTLANTLKSTFQQAKDEGWSSDRVADSLADAIHAFIQAADVTGVVVEVRNTSNVVIGTGQQMGTGSLQ